MSEPNCPCRKLLSPLMPTDEIRTITTHVCAETRRESCFDWAISQAISVQSVGVDLTELMDSIYANPDKPVYLRLPDGRTGRFLLSKGTISIVDSLVLDDISSRYPIIVLDPKTGNPIFHHDPETGAMKEVIGGDPNMEIILIVQQWVGTEPSEKYGDHLKNVVQSDDIARRQSAMPLMESLKSLLGLPDERSEEERKQESITSAIERASDQSGVPKTPGALEYLTSGMGNGVSRAGLLTTLICQIKDKRGTPCNSTIIQDFSLPYSGTPGELFEKAGEKAKCHAVWWEGIAEKWGIPLMDMDMRQFNSSKSYRSPGADDFIPQTPDEDYEHEIEKLCLKLARCMVFDEMSQTEARKELHGYAKPRCKDLSPPRIWGEERRRINKILTRRFANLTGK
jgi:hypothetical protein